MRLRRLEINGGRVIRTPSLVSYPAANEPSVMPMHRLMIMAVAKITNDLRRDFPHFPGTELSLRARFSHPANTLKGTAGFGFWNAPFGDPTVRWPALPQATWFFFASEPNDLPFAESGPGQGVVCRDAGCAEQIRCCTHPIFAVYFTHEPGDGRAAKNLACNPPPAANKFSTDSNHHERVAYLHIVVADGWMFLPYR